MTLPLPESSETGTIEEGQRVRHVRTGEHGIVTGRQSRTLIRVRWDSGMSGLAHLDHLRDPEQRNPRACDRCGDTEPFHVHDGDRRIENYFTVGRGQTDFEAAQTWKRRALVAERSLAALMEGEPSV